MQAYRSEEVVEGEIVDLIQALGEKGKSKNRILDRLVELSKQYAVKVSFVDSDGNARTLYMNRHTIGKLRDVLMFSNERIFNGTPGVMQYASDFVLSRVSNVKIFLVERTAHGAFFPYLNTSSYDLSKYQVYSEGELSNDMHCLLYTLEQYGVDVGAVSEMRGPIKKKDLSSVANILGIKINLKVYPFVNGMYNTEKVIFTSYGNSKKIVQIGLIEGHYVFYEMCFRHSSSKKVMSSLRLIAELYNEGVFTQIVFQKLDKPKHVLIGNIENQQTLIAKPVFKNRKQIVSFADTECLVNSYHIPIVYARIVLNEDLKEPNTSSTSTTIKDNSNLNYQVFVETEFTERGTTWLGFKAFLNSFPKGYNTVYYHNLKYDWSVLKKCPYINIQNIVKKEGFYYSVTFTFFGNFFELRDSHKLIPQPLKNLSSMFGLEEQKKEFILYDLFTKDNMCTDYVTIRPFSSKDLYLPFYSVDKSKFTRQTNQTPNTDSFVLDERLVISNIPEDISRFFENDRYYHIAHYRYYIYFDCLVLKNALVKYRSIMQSCLNVDCFQELTLSSMVHKRALANSHYEGVFEVTGSLLQFIKGSIQGGRVNSWNGRSVDVRGKIQALDGKSLYPSAIRRICREGGFPRGKAYTMALFDPNAYWYVVRIKILSVGKHQQIPFLNYTEGKKRVYTNNMEGIVVTVDKITLEDWIEFHRISFKFIDGVCWNSGGINTMGTFVEKLYEERVNAGKDNRALNEVYKLALNSLFGKTIMKETETKTVIVKNSKAEEYILENFESLVDEETQANQTIFTVLSEKIGHSNASHVGGMILSMARRIMNEVMDLANDNNILIIYQDTDSMHVVDSLETRNDRNVDKLSELYLSKYGKILVGDSLEQFNCDFKFADHTEIYSRRSIVLGKKAYLDIVCGTNNSSGEVEETLHYRMKGINWAAMDEYEDKVDLYERMLNGEKIRFNLCFGDGVSFSFQEYVKTKNEFIKTVGFPGDPIVLF